jgi:hypothetical protein
MSPHFFLINILTKSFPSHFTHTFLILTKPDYQFSQIINNNIMDGLTPEQEWSKALSHELLYNEIINHWGWEICDEYGSYANCAPFQRDRILEWLRRKPYYREYLEEMDAAHAHAQAAAAAAEAQAAAVGSDDEAESTFDVKKHADNLENRITYLEATFAHLKEMRARKGRYGASSSKAEGSRKKKVNWLFRLVVELFSLSCFVWLSSFLV